MRRGWSVIPYFKAKAEVGTSVSIIIAARNEEENIERTICAILNQHFPKDKLELIIVDDHSTDKTAEIISSYSNQGVKLLQLDIRRIKKVSIY